MSSSTLASKRNQTRVPNNKMSVGASVLDKGRVTKRAWQRVAHRV